jgi:hypothetical protein
MSVAVREVALAVEASKIMSRTVIGLFTRRGYDWTGR